MPNKESGMNCKKCSGPLYRIVKLVLLAVVFTLGAKYGGNLIGTLGIDTPNVAIEESTSDSDDEHSLADIPETAFGPAIAEKGYHMEEIGKNLYYVTEGMYQIMFLVTEEGVVVVDAPPSMVQYVQPAIAEVTELPITHVIYSHIHADHIAGAGVYPEDAIYIAHIETKNRLEQDRNYPYGAYVGGGEIPIPTITFEDNYILKVGGETLQLDYKGASHTEGNIFVYAPDQKVLLYIDVIFPGWSPFKGLAITEQVPAYLEAHDRVLSYDFEKLVSGHLGRIGTREDVEVQKEYILDIQKNAETAIQTIDFQTIASEVGYENPWFLFDSYLFALTHKCTELTNKKWVGKLGGVDVFTESHCDRIVESIRVD